MTAEVAVWLFEVLAIVAAVESRLVTDNEDNVAEEDEEPNAF